MHELSIARSLVNVTSETAVNAGIQLVKTVHLKLGELSGVVSDALLFSYDIATQGTVLEGSQLKIETIPVAVDCPNCGVVELPSVQRFRCPHCDTATAVIVRGKELEISHLEYDDGTDTP